MGQHDARSGAAPTSGEGGADSPRAPAPRFLVVAAQVLALTSFVVAAPLLDVLGKNPTFFVAHGVEGTDLVLFALAVIVMPAAVIIAGLGLVRIVAARAFPLVTAAIVGALVALAVVPMLDRTLRLSSAAFMTLLGVVAVTAAFAYHRWSVLRTYVTYLTPAPVLFLVVFLGFSPSNVLLQTGDGVAAAAVHGSDTPVVFVVFDEFPLGLLLDEAGAIDAARFPGFARLAADSTWYRRAVTVAPWTHLAVPALLTGERPDNAVPVAATHPRSLFTLLARSHRLDVRETLTQLCPADRCARHASDQADLAHDTSVVYLHSLLPDQLESDWLPPIGERWSDFRDAPARPTDDGQAVTFEQYQAGELYAFVTGRDAQPGRFADFVDSIAPGGSRPGLWFLHSLLPHLPWQYLPDGRPYDDPDHQPAMVGTGACGCRRDPGEAKWSSDAGLVSTAVQRLALQSGLVDRLVGGLLDRLEAQGLFDDALVVVTADHGITFEPGRRPRGGAETDTNAATNLDARVRNELLPVPLFIKLPHQRAGRVDDRDAQTIDVVPTIVDALGLDLPPSWRFDGRSLLGPRGAPRPLVFTPDVAADQQETIRDRLDVRASSAYFRSVLGASGGAHDLFSIAPYGTLVGQPAEPLARSTTRASARLVAPSLYDSVDLSGIVPAQLEATVAGLDPGDWVAVAVDDTIAGTGPVYDEGGTTRVVAMLDPSLLHDGHDTIELYRIAPDGQSLARLGRG